MVEGIGKSIGDAFKFLSILIGILLPLGVLGIWKLIEIIIWCCHHIHIG